MSETSQIIDQLIDFMFSHEYNRLKINELRLVKKNREASGGALDGFFYMGHFCSDLDVKSQVRGKKGLLHASLVPEMDNHLKDLGMIQEDERWVRQALAIVLTDTHSLQDIRDALPEMLCELKVFNGLERQRDEAWNIQGNPRAVRQYQQLRDKLEIYTASRLIY